MPMIGSGCDRMKYSHKAYTDKETDFLVSENLALPCDQCKAHHLAEGVTQNDLLEAIYGNPQCHPDSK